MDNLIYKLNNLYYSYLGKIPALSGVSMEIKSGQKICVIGANGSGKSTLLQILDGLIFPDTGEVKFGQQVLNEKKFQDDKFCQEFRRKVGFVFQNPDVQLFCPTVEEDIVFGPLQLGFSKAEIKQRLDKLAYALELKDLLKRLPHQLSIGEKRKVAIASVLIIQPEVIILDEPTAGLDPLTSRRIIDILIEENAKGKTIITATHDLHIVEEISDLVYVFNNQKTIIRFGQPSVVLNDNALLESNNLVHIHSHKHKDKVHVHPHLHLDHHAGEH
ncbi:MAG: ABC transporter ATP-binding protein [Candidatus Omnitrophota bacterium]